MYTEEYREKIKKEKDVRVEIRISENVFSFGWTRVVCLSKLDWNLWKGSAEIDDKLKVNMDVFL